MYTLPSHHTCFCRVSRPGSSKHYSCNNYAAPPSMVSALPSSPQGQPAPGVGRKKAVIIGICYRKTKSELHGCINDAKCMEYMLIHRFNFPQDSIYMLTEAETHPMGKPTSGNIKSAMSWLVQGCQPGDSLVFYYSGHGGRRRDDNGDERDGYDETLVPLDHETEGEIRDDEINATLVRPLPHGVRLHAIIDACYSGTVMDLPYLCSKHRTGRYSSWEDHSPKSGLWKGTSGGEVISFSGCDDHQISVEQKLSPICGSIGAMTFSFIQAIHKGHGDTYGTLLRSMRKTIKKKHSSIRRKMSKVRAMFIHGRKYVRTQKPQLTASVTFDVDAKVFAL